MLFANSLHLTKTKIMTHAIKARIGYVSLESPFWTCWLGADVFALDLFVGFKEVVGALVVDLEVVEDVEVEVEVDVDVDVVVWGFSSDCAVIAASM